MIGRVDVGQLERRIDVELHGPILGQTCVVRKRFPPAFVLQAGTQAVVVPVLPTSHAIDAPHVLMRRRVVRRQRRMVWIVGVVVATARINLDAVVRLGPARVAVALADHAVGVAICLRSILRSRAAAEQHGRGRQQRQHGRRAPTVAWLPHSQIPNAGQRDGRGLSHEVRHAAHTSSLLLSRRRICQLEQVAGSPRCSPKSPRGAATRAAVEVIR